MKKLNIPKKQSDIKVKNFLKYQEFIEGLTDEQKEDEAFIIKNTVMIFYDLNEEEFEVRPYQSILDLSQIITNILSTPAETIYRFKMEDIEYGLNPNFNDMSFGEFTDCETQDVLQQICILYRPIIKKKKKWFKKDYTYKIETYKSDISQYDKFKENLTLDIYLGFISFFLKIHKSLTNYILKSTTDQDINQQKKKILEKNGLGFQLYMI